MSSRRPVPGAGAGAGAGGLGYGACFTQRVLHPDLLLNISHIWGQLLDTSHKPMLCFDSNRQ